MAGIAKGLDWNHSAEPDADRRAEMMLWSLVHGYATLTLGGQFAVGPPGVPIFDVSEIAPVFGYLD